MFFWPSIKNLSLGRWGEVIARREYRKQGYSILGSNIFNRRGKQMGEVDFIAKSSTAIIFVEVKTRTQDLSRFGSAAQAVDIFKQRKLLKIVKLFLIKHPQYHSLRPQIDVCAIEVNRLDRADYSVTIVPNAVEDR